MQVILISGKANSGKTFLAEQLKEYIEINYSLKGYIINFADPLKMVCEKIYGWDGYKNEVGRTLLQSVGTDIVHQRDKMTWVKIIITIMEALRGEFDFVIIGDARFNHEVDGILAHFTSNVDAAFPILVLGDTQSPLTEVQKSHPSETELDAYKNFSYVFKNYPHNLYTFFYQIAELCNVINIDEWSNN